MSRLFMFGLVAMCGACTCSRSEPPPVKASAQAAVPSSSGVGTNSDASARPGVAIEAGAAKGPRAPAEPTPDHDQDYQDQPLAVCRAEGRAPLEAARSYFDDGKYDEALSCAAQASALEPDSPSAHAERGAALAALGKTGEAQVAFARALALDPDDPDALYGAAHLFAVQLPSTRERDELGLVYAEHGLAQAGDDPELVMQFALLAAMAHNDLGQAQEALDRASLVLARKPGEKEAQYERALALFELCRFNEAKTAFRALLDDPERGAHAHHHLGLLLEREGRFKQAEEHFAKARAMAPDDFPPVPTLSETEFKAEVQSAVAALPPDMRKDLAGVPVTAEELPKEQDLLSGEPPLSPTILGLFRGPPLNEACDGSEQPCRSVALYHRNLARAVRTREELIEQIRVTLLHEVGHLRGEDDGELAARGLE